MSAESISQQVIREERVAHEILQIIKPMMPWHVYPSRMYNRILLTVDGRRYRMVVTEDEG
jgi:hypothetical protein